MTSLLSLYQLDSSRSLREFAAKTSSPDPESRRGRKRHRSLTRSAHDGLNCGGTGESSNLRGRARRRSTSPVGTTSRTASQAHRGPEAASASLSLSPARKRLLRVLILDRRRSQSPSRSRSPNTPLQQTPLRRRQRTRSRSRNHADTSLPAAASRLVEVHHHRPDAPAAADMLLQNQATNPSPDDDAHKVGY